jgi:hypothetical protein
MTISQRKFLQAAFVQISGCVALFTGKIDGGVYVALSTLALSIYAAANVMDKKMGGEG